MRLAKYLAHAGVASRRAAERLIASGRVSVAGEVVTDPARDVDSGVVVAVDGEPVRAERRVVYAVNKPRGVVSTAADTHGRPTVVEMIPAEARRLYPVGRLDADSTGLLLLTNDGELANLLTHPRYGVEKVYRARVVPGLNAAAIDALRDGVQLDDGLARAERARQVSSGVLEIALREGRKRQVRRMCEAVGRRVVELERVRFGPLRLGTLKQGSFRKLTPAEVDALRESAALLESRGR
ncbi:MAG: rRNA synthase [Thermoleophilaceae bacterium]|jgi:23S rRNA pseudouridine2605 synthase|nr:rRNA synthase [Thermoleophilaceae bacterium]